MLEKLANVNYHNSISKLNRVAGAYRLKRVQACSKEASYFCVLWYCMCFLFKPAAFQLNANSATLCTNQAKHIPTRRDNCCLPRVLSARFVFERRSRSRSRSRSLTKWEALVSRSFKKKIVLVALLTFINLAYFSVYHEIWKLFLLFVVLFVQFRQ